MADGYTETTVGMEKITQKITKLRGMKEYGVKLICNESRGTLQKLVPGQKKIRQAETEIRSAGQNVTILRAHAKGGNQVAIDGAGKTIMRERGNAKWKKIYVGEGANKRLVKRVLVRIGRKLKSPTALKRNLPSRNIDFFDDSEIAAGDAIWADGIVDALKNDKDPSAALQQRATKIGKHMVATYRNHIDSSKGKDGPLKPVLDSTARSKLRQTGVSGLPPLKRTGQLYNSFDFSVKRYR